MTAVAVTATDGNTKPSVVQGAKLALKAGSARINATYGGVTSPDPTVTVTARAA